MSHVYSSRKEEQEREGGQRMQANSLLSKFPQTSHKGIIFLAITGAHLTTKEARKYGTYTE